MRTLRPIFRVLGRVKPVLFMKKDEIFNVHVLEPDNGRCRPVHDLPKIWSAKI